MIRRRLFRIVSVTSLVLCMATIALWVQSYRVDHWFGYATALHNGEWKRLRLASGSGGIEFNFQRKQQRTPLPPGTAGFFFMSLPASPSGIFSPTPDPETFWYRHNFAFVNIHWSWWTYVGFLVPHWLVAVLLAVLPIISLRRHWHMSARGAAHPACSDCGYNLTANTSGVCPECGAPIELTTG